VVVCLHIHHVCQPLTTFFSTLHGNTDKWTSTSSHRGGMCYSDPVAQWPPVNLILIDPIIIIWPLVSIVKKKSIWHGCQNNISYRLQRQVWRQRRVWEAIIACSWCSVICMSLMSSSQLCSWRDATVYVVTPSVEARSTLCTAGVSEWAVFYVPTNTV